MQPKTKLILYSVIGVLLLSIIIISFFINSNLNNIDDGIYKEPEIEKKTDTIQADNNNNNIIKYGCENVTSSYQNTCIIMGQMIDPNGFWLVMMFLTPLIIFSFVLRRNQMFMLIILMIIMSVIINKIWVSLITGLVIFFIMAIKKSMR